MKKAAIGNDETVLVDQGLNFKNNPGGCVPPDQQEPFTKIVGHNFRIKSNEVFETETRFFITGAVFGTWQVKKEDLSILDQAKLTTAAQDGRTVQVSLVTTGEAGVAKPRAGVGVNLWDY